MVDIVVVDVEKPEGMNVIIGQTHFIKTVEDIYETLVTCVPNIKFGMAFCESSGDCLVRFEGTDDKLKDIAVKNALNIAAGHMFIIVLGNAYPINVLNAVKNVPEVCTIFCATANDVKVVVAESETGRGILGVIDGSKPKGVESGDKVTWRKDILRKLGYKPQS
jgi:hypothetical protein